MTSVATLPAVRAIAIGLIGLAFSCSLLFAVAPKAHAASLSPAQVSAIVSLLQSFGADQTTINNVQAALGGGVVVPAQSSSVTVSAGTQPANGLAPQGTYIPFTTFVLTNTGNAPTTVTSVTVQRTGVKSSDDAAFAAVYVATASGGDLGNVSSFDANHEITLPMYITLQAGESKTYTVSGMMAANLSAYASDVVGFSVLSVTTNEQVGGTLPVTGSSQTLSTVNVCSNQTLSGYQCWLTPPTAGTLSVALDANTPAYGVVAAGSTGVTLGSFRFTATSESETLRTVSVAIDDSDASPSDFVTGSVTLWNGSTQVGTAVLVNHPAQRWDGTATLTSSVVVPQNGSITLTVKGNINVIGKTAPLSASGDALSLAIDGAMAVGNSSGSSIQGSFGQQYALTTQFTPGIRVYKSFPTFTYSTAGGTVMNGSNTLLTLTVAADSHGDVQLNKLTFSSSVVGATLTNPTLVGPNGSVGTATVDSRNNISVTFNNANNPTDAYVSAGQTKTYQLMGTLAGVTANSSVWVALKADTAAVAVGTASSIGTSNIIWSPESINFSTPTSADWTNSYGLGGCYSQSGLGQDCFSNVLTGTTPTPTPPAPTPTLIITADAGTAANPIPSGSSVNLTWTSSGMGACGIAPSEPTQWAGNWGLSGTKNTGPLAQTTTFTLQCNASVNGVLVGSPYNSSVTVYVAPTSTPAVPTSPTLPTPVLTVMATQQFNGSSSYTAYPSVGDSQAFTASAWVTLSGTACSVVFSDADSAAGNDVFMGIDATHIYIRADKGGSRLTGSGCLGSYAVALPSNISGSLHQVAWVNAGSNSAVYLDGTLVATVPLSGSNVGYHNNTFTLGRFWDGATGSYRNGADYFNGTMQGFKYWNSALSSSQIQQLYTAGALAEANAHVANFAVAFVQTMVSDTLFVLASPFTMTTNMLSSVLYWSGLY